MSMKDCTSIHAAWNEFIGPETLATVSEEEQRNLKAVFYAGVYSMYRMQLEVAGPGEVATDEDETAGRTTDDTDSADIKFEEFMTRIHDEMQAFFSEPH